MGIGPRTYETNKHNDSPFVLAIWVVFRKLVILLNADVKNPTNMDFLPLLAGLSRNVEPLPCEVDLSHSFCRAALALAFAACSFLLTGLATQVYKGGKTPGFFGRCERDISAGLRNEILIPVIEKDDLEPSSNNRLTHRTRIESGRRSH